MTEIHTYKKPSKFSLFWFQNYFSSNPATVFQEDKVFYTTEGYAISRSPRSYQYWVSDSSCLTCYSPYRYWYCGHCYFGDGNCCDGEAGGIVAIVMLVILAILAFIMACAIVFYYPPVMILSWLILVVGSFTQSIVGFAPECFGIRWYNGVCSLFVAIVTVFIISSVVRLQKLYRGYYPGTPQIQVDVPGLMQLFRISRIFYLYFCLPSCCLLIAGFVLSTTCILTRKVEFGSCPHFQSCQWTSITMYSWIVIHALNAVAAIGMYQRMQAKYKLLKEPPAYEPLEQVGYPAVSIVAPTKSESLPTYST